MRLFLYKIAFICFALYASFSLSAQVVNTGICISYDGKAMIYTGMDNDGKVQFYQSNKNALWRWGEGVAINSLNNYLDSVPTVIKDPFLSYDGQSLYFSANMAGSEGLNIYCSHLKNGEWQKPTSLSSKINTDADEESPSVTADNKYLYFTRKAVPVKPLADEEYCRTIYRSARNEQGIWQEPETVKISGLACEAYPVILPDGKTLFFSSSKLPQKRKQKYDVYYVKEDSPGVWSTPIELDSINTEANDISIAVDFQAKQVYVLQLEQTRKETTTKLASTSLPKTISNPTFTNLVSKITDLNSKAPVVATVIIRDPITLDVINTVQNNEQGKLRLMLLNGRNYKFDYHATAYSQYSNTYILSNTNYNHIQNDSIQLFKTVNLKLNIYDKSVFNPLNARIIAIAGKTRVNAEKQDIAGQFTLKLPVDNKYEVTIEHEGYISQSFTFDLSKTIFFNNFKEDIALIVDKKLYTIKVNANNTPVDARVEILNALINESVDVNDSDRKGIASANLRKTNIYDISVTKKAFSFDNRRIKAGENNIDTIKINLIPLSKQTKIALSTVAFADNSLDITTESYNELNCLVSLMLENPEITVEIGTYTDNKASDAYCNRLTTNRARSVVDYLVLRGGVTKDRLSFKGYGKTAPSDLNYTGNATKGTKSFIWFMVIEPAKVSAQINVNANTSK